MRLVKRVGIHINHAIIFDLVYTYQTSIRFASTPSKQANYMKSVRVNE